MVLLLLLLRRGQTDRRLCRDRLRRREQLRLSTRLPCQRRRQLRGGLWSRWWLLLMLLLPLRLRGKALLRLRSLWLLDILLRRLSLCRNSVLFLRLHRIRLLRQLRICLRLRHGKRKIAFAASKESGSAAIVSTAGSAGTMNVSKQRTIGM